VEVAERREAGTVILQRQERSVLYDDTKKEALGLPSKVVEPLHFAKLPEESSLELDLVL
jgi:hypothetical protein